MTVDAGHLDCSGGRDIRGGVASGEKCFWHGSVGNRCTERTCTCRPLCGDAGQSTESRLSSRYSISIRQCTCSTVNTDVDTNSLTFGFELDKRGVHVLINRAPHDRDRRSGPVFSGGLSESARLVTRVGRKWPVGKNPLTRRLWREQVRAGAQAQQSNVQVLTARDCGSTWNCASKFTGSRATTLAPTPTCGIGSRGRSRRSGRILDHVFVSQMTAWNNQYIYPEMLMAKGGRLAG